MSSEPLVLVFDVGTQSARTMIVNPKGKVLAKSKMSYDPPYVAPMIDTAEQNPDVYYEALVKTCRRVKDAEPTLFSKVEAVSITTIRDTLVFVDAEGKPLRSAILWLDKRSAQGKPPLSTFRKNVFRAAGMLDTVTTQYRKSHVNWVREEEPDLYKHTAHVLLLSTYLIFKITGKMVDSVASAIGHIPFDNKHRRWMSSSALTYPVFPIEEEKLFPLVETGTVLGHVQASMSEACGLQEGLPVYATGSDKACELLGLGCVKEEQVAIGLGTTATITYMSSKYREPEKYIPAYCSVIPGKYNPEIEIFRGYWLISWFKKEFAAKEVVEAKRLSISPEELLNQHLASVPPGCEGLMFQPYFTPNITMPAARGAVIGFSDAHTRYHLYRAIVEGINYALISGLETMKKRHGVDFKRIAIGGGGSQSDEICQITADMFGLPVERPLSYEATGVGSALATYVGMGYYPSYEKAVAEGVRIAKHFQPNAQVHDFYRALYEDIFKAIFPNLSPLYSRLNRLYKNRRPS